MLAPRIVARAASARERQDAVSGWVAAGDPCAPILIVAPSPEAGIRVVRRAMKGRAVLGWQRATPGELWARLAARELAKLGLAQVGHVVLEAVCARVVYALHQARALGRFQAVGDRPGLPRPLVRTFGELGAAGVDPQALPPDLGRLYASYRAELAAQGLADRADVLRAAIATITQAEPHPLLDLPLVLLDVAVRSVLEARAWAALGRRAPIARAVIPLGDRQSARRLSEAWDVPASDIADDTPSSALARLRRGIFAERPSEGEGDASVELISAPGENRECVELARRVLREAARGVAFDRMAILAHAPERYRAHLTEALRRARIPAYFSRGTLRPDPAGRALLALLDCRKEDLSARAFAEYLSLGVVPDAAEDGAPPAAGFAVPWLPPEDDLIALPAFEPEPAPPSQPFDAEAPVVAGTLRAPRRWERLLVDAAVIGGIDRWRTRLDGLARSLSARAGEDGDEARGVAIRTQQEDLQHLRAFALPLLEALAELPRQATWGEWAERLAILAERALREPAHVLKVLRELLPMGPIGPVGLTEVRLVLSRRLTEIVRAPSGSPAGKLFVAAIDEARGLSFDVVLVPGLAERVFPRKLTEDPIALDALRRELDAELDTTDTRVEHERLALRLAIGAAERKIVLSYPRLDTERGRPQVPSFYALEVLRAVEGTLPSFEELAQRAERAGDARLGWPAPHDPKEALDGPEYDLAVLQQLLREPSDGAMRYLMHVNPHLARALRARWMRWSSPKWTSADGVVAAGDAFKGWLAQAHGLAQRPYSATALERYAACPYRFFLRDILRLAPRKERVAIEELDPVERGRIFHDAQFELLTRLRAQGALPVTSETLEAVYAELDEVVVAIEARWRQELVPAIERVWTDAIDSIRTDLREWLLRAAEHPEWIPRRFELSFGQPPGEHCDPASVPEPLALDGLSLRGAIDLVEERDGKLRATDHKTGAPHAERGTITAGGKVLQPLLYARALEALFPSMECQGGRLYYCTTRGRFEERVVPLDASSRQALALVVETVGNAITQAYLPAAPDAHECERCDYRVVCGPAEERRVARKQPAPIGPLLRLRRQR